jgi:hypothetical protein
VRKRIHVLLLPIVGAFVAAAAQNPIPGIIISGSSVACDAQQQSKRQATAQCQQYTVRSTRNEYQIRQAKPSDKAAFPANTPIYFTLEKEKMKFKINNKTYEFLVVSTSAIDP